MHKIMAALSGSLAFLIISACGGGGGSANVGPGPTVSKATIDSANAQTIASRAANVAFQSGSFGNVSGIFGVTAATTGGLAKLGSNQVSKASGSGSVISEVPVGPETTICAVSGSFTISGDIASLVTLTVNDFFIIDWDNCDEGIGAVIDGSIRMTITSFEGDLNSGQVLLGNTLAIDNFRVTAGNEFSNADGDLTVTVDSRTAPVTSASTSGTSFSLSSNVSTETLSNFSSTVTEDASVFPATNTAAAMGTITSTQFSGEVSYDTPVIFQSLGDAYPHSGELLVTGANNATLRLVAIDEVNVRIDADYDGDGVVDEATVTTWDALFNG